MTEDSSLALACVALACCHDRAVGSPALSAPAIVRVHEGPTSTFALVPAAGGDAQVLILAPGTAAVSRHVERVWPGAQSAPFTREDAAALAAALRRVVRQLEALDVPARDALPDAACLPYYMLEGR